MSTVLTVPFHAGSTTLSLMEKCKSMQELRQIHCHFVKTGLMSHTMSVARLIAVCSVSGTSSSLDYAVSIFHQIQEPKPSIFFSIVKILADGKNPKFSFIFYAQMLHCLENFQGVEFSLPSVLKSCGKILAFKEGQQLHGLILKTQFWFDPFVSNSLLRMYLDLGEMGIARLVFEKMPDRDVVCWNSMIAGYFKDGDIASARKMFDEMPERDLVSWNSMIDGYMKCGAHDLAREIFDGMNVRDVVSWTAMVSGYVLNDCPMEALELFKKMLGLGLRPDIASLVSVLSAIADLGFVEEGKWVHTYICRNKIKLCSGVLGSALIDMYAKCGFIENAFHVFEGIMYRRSVGDWNSIISGLASHGLSREALEVFHEMVSMKIEPNEITFLGILTACSHGGLVQEGRFYFELMHGKYHMVPRIQHYGCLIDLLGRTGLVEEADRVIDEMPIAPDTLVWKAMLSACVRHGHIISAERAAMRAIDLAPHDSGTYVLLSNIYAKAGRWDDVARVRSMMKDRGVRKVPGCSSIAVDGEIHQFLVGKEMDLRHRDMVLCKLEEMICRLKMEGYEPDLTQVLVDAEEEEKEGLLSLHSEKLAIAFGLINMGKVGSIHVIKNLRVCSDCHSFCKMVSKVYGCRIVLRDQNRFHHFKSGFCSCHDYW